MVSTVFTLFLVPTLFSLMVEFKAWLGGLFGIRRAAEATPVAEAS
jgi:hypothetical protein